MQQVIVLQSTTSNFSSANPSCPCALAPAMGNLLLILGIGFGILIFSMMAHDNACSMLAVTTSFTSLVVLCGFACCHCEQFHPVF